MLITVVIPTYIERENIGRLIDELLKLTLPHDLSVLVVDDSSPDGTAEVVKQKMTQHANISMISGPKKGLGVAYVRGFKYAFETLKSDAVVEMDADFSHDPQDLPRLIEELDKGADFVIGSRYIKGGSIPSDWGIRRVILSKYGNLIARLIAGLYSVHDCTAGYRIIRRSLFDKIDFDDLKVKGYAFQIALLDRALDAGGKVREVPVHFIDRTKGKTKLGYHDLLEFMLNAWWIRFEKSKTFIKFSIVGFSGVLMNLGCFSLLLHAGLHKYAASPLGIEASIVTNFLLNNFWTFSKSINQSKIHIKGMKFNIVSIGSMGISFTTFIIMGKLLPHLPLQIHQAIGIAPAMLFNYLTNVYWTFSIEKETA